MVFGSDSNNLGYTGFPPSITLQPSYPASSNRSEEIAAALKAIKKSKGNDTKALMDLATLAASDPRAAEELGHRLRASFAKQAQSHLKSVVAQLHADSGKRHKEWMEKQKHLLDGEDDGSSMNFLT